MTLPRLRAVMRETRRIRAEDALTALACINRGMTGGDAYRRFHRRLAKRAGIKD